ncbi:MAG: hypothetical protein IJP39_01545, partial [Bacteroidales bacterium]|nr:hypothetical protein [Bacteroidales bacterium]
LVVVGFPETSSAKRYPFLKVNDFCFHRTIILCKNKKDFSSICQKHFPFIPVLLHIICDQFSLLNTLVAYMVTDFASFWIDSPWECGG